MHPITAFVVAAYALSIALSLVIGLTGGHQSPLIALSYLSMFLPAVAVLIVRVTLHESPRLHWDTLPVRYLPVALFLIPVVMHAAMLPVMAALSGGIQWQAPRGWGILTGQALIARIALNAVAGLAVVTLLALFEEIGWRAWLLPRLLERMGARHAVLLSAVIWALWHVPFQLSGIQHIDGISPLRLVLAVTPGTLGAGLIIGWLWLRTESIWLCAIAHGAMNNWGQYTFKYMKDSGNPAADFAVLLAGSLAVLAAGGLLLWFGAGKRRQFSDGFSA